MRLSVIDLAGRGEAEKEGLRRLSCSNDTGRSGWLARVGSATHPDLSQADPASRHIYTVQVREPPSVRGFLVPQRGFEMSVKELEANSLFPNSLLSCLSPRPTRPPPYLHT